MISRLDERSAAVAARSIERQFETAGKNAGDAATKSLNAEINRSTANLHNSFTGQFTNHGQTAGRNFGTGFTGQVNQSVSNTSGFTAATAGYSAAASRTGTLAGRAMGLAFTAAATGLVGAAGYTLFKGFERYQSIDAAKNRLDNLNRTLEQTGRAGIDVGKVMDTVGAVVEGTRFPLDQAFSISSRALASPTGDLERFMTAVADTAQFTGESLDSVGDAFLKISNSGKVSMEELSNELRGLPQSWLADHFKVSGAELTKMISDGKVGFKDLLETVEANVSGFAKGSVDTLEGVIDQAHTAVARLGANFLGALFGAPTDDANTLKDAIKAVTDRLNEVNTWVTAHQDDIKKYFDTAIEVGGDLLAVLGDIAQVLGEHPGLVWAIVGAWGGFKALSIGSSLATMVTALTGANTALAAMPALAGAALGPLAALAAVAAGGYGAWKLSEYLLDNYSTTGPPPVLPNMPSNLDGTPKSGSLPNIPGMAPTPTVNGIPSIAGIPIPGLQPTQAVQPGQQIMGMPPLPGHGMHFDPVKGWVLDGGVPAPVAPPGGAGPAGSPILDAPGLADGDGKGPRLPPAPAVPYADLPALDPRLQMTASLFSAQTSVADAQTRHAEKEARLNQLLQTNVATADEILAARTDVAQADRAAQEAQLRFGETQKSALEAQYKQLDKLNSDLGQLGASLDSDFGISKGLSGIAENITKFVANLAAAPLLGQLGAISAANPSQGGHGIVGTLAAQGAFGSKYTGIDYSKQAAAMGPAALRPGGGYPGDAALLANVPAGRYTQEARGDLTQGLADCSSAVEDLVNMMDGRPTSGASMSTGNAAEWLQSRGFQPGTGGPGDFRVGYNAGHMQATLPGGTPFNWGTQEAAARGGVGGTGADDPAFTSHYYRPVGGPAAAPVGSDIYSPANTSPALTNPPAPTTSGAYASNPATPPMMAGGPVGTGMPQSAPFANNTPIGGVDPLQGTGSGGVGASDGLMGAALAAAGGLDLLMPGAGQAAQTATKLINRTIQYGSQAVGIGVQGAMDTFVPFGGSKLAQSNWFTRLVGGVAGAAPALPNTAGKGSAPLQPGQVDANAGGQGGQASVTNNTTINTNRDTISGTARDWEYHGQQQNSMPGQG